MPRPMKDSGVKWLGEIPAHWKIHRMKSCIADKISGSWGNEATHEDGDIICLRIADFDYSKFRFKDIPVNELTVRNYDRTSINRLLLRKGDILIEKSGGGEKTPVGRTVIFDKDYPALYANFMDRLRCSNLVLSQWLQYVFVTFYKNGYSKNYIKQTIGIQNLDLTTMLANERIPVPPLDEQQRIATFLDGECARIDSVIEKTCASIVEYKKLKQAVITRAVTKGIRPARTMKDSGVEWLGEIPADWEIIPIKYLCSYNDEVLQENTDADFTFDYIEIGSVEFGKGIIEMQRVRFADAPSRARRIVQENDIIVSTVRTYLKAVAQIPYSETPLIASTGFVVIRPKNVNHIFLKYAILSNVIISMIESNSVGISYPAINAFQVVRFKIPVPPMEEQKEIAQYLDEKTAAIDLLVEKKEQLLTELERLKKSLIFEYVTGKKAVAQ